MAKAFGFGGRHDPQGEERQGAREVRTVEPALTFLEKLLILARKERGSFIVRRGDEYYSTDRPWLFSRTYRWAA